MKKILYLLLIACIMVACSKDDSPIVNPLEDMYGTLWVEQTINVKSYDKSNILFHEHTSIAKGAVGGAFAHYYIDNSYIGYLLKRYPNENDREFPVYYIRESAYQLDSSNNKLKIGDDIYSLIEFTPSRIIWELTTYFDEGYTVYTTTLLPDNSQNWESMVEAARAENKRFIEQYDNYTPPQEGALVDSIESMSGTVWVSSSRSTSIHYTDGTVVTNTKYSDLSSLTTIYYVDSAFIGRIKVESDIINKTTNYICDEFKAVTYDKSTKSLACDNINFTLSEFSPETIKWSYTIKEGDGYIVKMNETLLPYQTNKSWAEWKAE